MLNIGKLLFPSHIGKFRLFNQKNLGIQLGESFIRASLTNTKQSSTVIEKYFEVSFEGQGSLISADGTIDENLLTKGLSQIYKQAGNIDYLSISIPANLCVFKELQVPFCQNEKISMILPFEAEALLPFPIENAALSFLKAQNNLPAKEQGCLITVCATQKSMLQSIKTATDKLKIKPDSITVDLVSIYGLYSQLENWTDHSQNYGIICISEFWTKIGIVHNNILQFVKNIPYGTGAIAQNLASICKISLEEAIKLIQTPPEQLLETNSFIKPLEEEYFGLCKKIQFALQSFISKQDLQVSLDKIIFVEEKLSLPGLIRGCQKQLNLPCQIFSPEKLLGPNKIINRASFQSNTIYQGIIALAAGLSGQFLNNFDLGKNIISKSLSDLIKQQLFAAFFIIIAIFGYIFITDHFKTNELMSGIKSTEALIKDLLVKNILKEQKIPRTMPTSRILEDASTTMKEMQVSWQNHGNDDLKPLEILLDLTRIIDRTKLELKINSINLSYDQNGHKALEINGNLEGAGGEQEMQKFVQQMHSLKRFNEIKTKLEKTNQETLFNIQTILEL